MQLQITGHIQGIEARNGGWFAVAIQEQGQNYPKKLSTKKPELVQMANQMLGQYVDALYNEAESTNINPNSGLPYMNRYLEAIGMAGSMPQQPMQQQPVQQQQVMQPQQQYQPQPMQPQPQQQYQPQPMPQPMPPPQIQQPVQQQAPIVTPQQKEERIMREAAAKVSVDLLQHLDPPDRNLANLIRISEQLVHYFANGVQWQVAPVQAPQPQAQQQQPVEQQYAPPPPDPGQAPDPYDDIPF